jgi:hypothetical protein
MLIIALNQGGREGLHVVLCIAIVVFNFFNSNNDACSLTAELSSGDARLIGRCQMN